MAEMELNVSKRMTHVVSTDVRTINLFRGIIRGCWLITLEWVLKSLEKNMWLNPEEFEMKHFSKAILVRQCVLRLIIQYDISLYVFVCLLMLLGSSLRILDQ